MFLFQPEIEFKISNILLVWFKNNLLKNLIKPQITQWTIQFYHNEQYNFINYQIACLKNSMAMF